MLNSVDLKTCCGCGACVQACPQKCISMVADAEGFLYPQIDPDACVRCGLCQKVCPLNAEKSQTAAQMTAYVAYAKNETIRCASSSGGIFSLLAIWAMEHHGVVFGAAFDDDHSVHHIMIERLEDLPKLQGSKYLQSRIGQTYQQAKEALEAGRIVLFSGTACQTAGLRSYLGRKYDQLYLVDVICHGAPSPKAWDRYLCWQKSAHEDTIQRVSFRDKVTGWKIYSVAINFSNAERYCRKQNEDPYMQAFLSDICLRPSCHNCAFKGTPRMSDITLGDAWGIQNWMPEMDDDRGTSVVLIHSPLGQKLWDAILPDVKAREGDAEAIIRDNPAFSRSVAPHPKRKQFFAALHSGASFAVLTRISRKTLPQKAVAFGKRVVKKAIKCLKHT